jgi:hypothetical protein
MRGKSSCQTALFWRCARGLSVLCRIGSGFYRGHAPRYVISPKLGWTWPRVMLGTLGRHSRIFTQRRVGCVHFSKVRADAPKRQAYYCSGAERLTRLPAKIVDSAKGGCMRERD